MADPLSIATGVVGLITATAHVSVILTKFTKSTIAAPKHAQAVLTEVSDIDGILSHLQSFLLGLDSPNISRTSLLKVDKVVTIVSGCVLTFSELEKMLDELKTGHLDVLDRLKWARKESAIVDLIHRLQNHKASLSLVLNILNGHTIAEAKDSVDRLHTFIEKCYQEMSSRVQALEILNIPKNDESWMLEDDGESVATITIHAHPSDLSSEGSIESEFGRSDFSDELQRSRVYRRNQIFRKSVISALTKSVYSLGSSFFSDLSMAEVSNVSVINLAITEGEVFNPRRTSQTWSAQPDQGPSIDNYGDGQRTRGYKIAHETTSVAIFQGNWPLSTQIEQQSLPSSRSTLPQSQPIETPEICPQPAERSEERLEERSEEEESTRNVEYPDLISILSPPEPSDPLSPLQAQTTSSPRSHEKEEDEAAFPCKGCGEILEEGKVFELAGNRWHIDCFSCNTCGIILDSDANLLLRDDGSLICNNCIHSCSVCNNKIEDLAILTGDQAFCATCFKCRNCKQKIENLKYARTSQGIWCMNCHESLMQRRRKKSQENRSNRHKHLQQIPNSTRFQDKSLTSLPPSAVHQNIFLLDHESPPSESHSETHAVNQNVNTPRNFSMGPFDPWLEKNLQKQDESS